MAGSVVHTRWSSWLAPRSHVVWEIHHFTCQNQTSGQEDSHSLRSTRDRKPTEDTDLCLWPWHCHGVHVHLVNCSLFFNCFIPLIFLYVHWSHEASLAWKFWQAANRKLEAQNGTKLVMNNYKTVTDTAQPISLSRRFSCWHITHFPIPQCCTAVEKTVISPGFILGYIQWCTSKLSLWGRNNTLFVVFLDSHSVYSPTRADFQLLTWSHWSWTCKEIHIIHPLELAPATTGHSFVQSCSKFCLSQYSVPWLRQLSVEML